MIKLIETISSHEFMGIEGSITPQSWDDSAGFSRLFKAWEQAEGLGASTEAHAAIGPSQTGAELAVANLVSDGVPQQLPLGQLSHADATGGEWLPGGNELPLQRQVTAQGAEIDAATEASKTISPLPLVDVPAQALSSLKAEVTPTADGMGIEAPTASQRQLELIQAVSADQADRSDSINTLVGLSRVAFSQADAETSQMKQPALMDMQLPSREPSTVPLTGMTDLRRSSGQNQYAQTTSIDSSEEGLNIRSLASLSESTAQRPESYSAFMRDTSNIMRDSGEGKISLDKSLQTSVSPGPRADVLPMQLQAATGTATSFAPLVADAALPGSLSAEHTALNRQVSDTPNQFMPLDVSRGFKAMGEALLSRISFAGSQGHQTIDIQLHPAELGAIEVKINAEDDQFNVTFYASQRSARDLLEAEMPRLRELFSQAGMNLQQGDVYGERDSRSSNPRDPGGGAATPQELKAAAETDEPEVRSTVLAAKDGSLLVDDYA